MDYSNTREKILQYLLKEGQGTAKQMAEVLGISSQGVRRHLNELLAESLILYESVQKGTGRPKHIYSLSDRGKSHFPHRYGEFALSFLDTLAETVGEDKVTGVLKKQWQRKAQEYRERLGRGSLKDRISKLVRLRQNEGYMAELHEDVTTENKQQFMFTEYNCAISDVAESYPSICGHELEMFSAILPDCTVERTNWINDGEHRCGYLIRAK